MMRAFFGFTIGALLGALVGVTLGILLAPTSGTELRGHIRERSAAVSAELKNAASARRVEIEKQFAQFRTTSNNVELPPAV